ncbi:FGGY-family carbohydrate kinase [Halobellus rufus]|uniref:FGGY-family carbohydrate kinase n=1 Tax=Halobellus rufus TaxID=1448860 RepID=UPI000678E069|nr:FGGY-family carbohydrate kinase [Halobellus rufus]
MKQTEVLLAVDAGTSAIKAVAFDTDGTELTTATRETQTLRPAHGYVEQEMPTVWRHTAAAIRGVTEALPDGADPIGVGITGQGDGLWAVTESGDPVRNAVLWSDSRAAEILERWETDGRLAEIIERCGSAPYPGMSLPLLAWLKREEPDRFERVDTVLSCKDWLTYKLTGERSIDHSEATVPYLSKSTERYDRSVFDLVDLPAAKETLPRLSAPTEIVGRVSERAADATSLEPGLPVVSGAFDVPASAVGTGAATTGGTAVTLGTSLTQQVFVDGPQSETSGIQMSVGVDGLWTYAIGSNAGTPSLEWAADAIAGGIDIETLEELAAAAEPGSGGVMYHPYLSTSGERGPFVEPDARGQFVGLSPEHSTEQLVRAVYEGLSFAVRDCVEHLPASPAEVTLSGGGTRSELWCQLVADCLRRPVVVPAGSEHGAKGAAIFLAVALDRYPSLESAVDTVVTIDRRYEPRENLTEGYETLYETFAEISREMRPLWSARADAFEVAFTEKGE